MTFSRIFPLALVVLFAAALPAQAGEKDAAQKDLDLLQGTWVLVSGQRNGETLPPEKVKGATMVIKGNTYKITEGIGTAVEGTFKLDASKSPKLLDATPSTGPDKGQTWLGIYTVDETSHAACLAPPGKSRPTKFDSPADSGVINEMWRKQE